MFYPFSTEDLRAPVSKTQEANPFEIPDGALQAAVRSPLAMDFGAGHLGQGMAVIQEMRQEIAASKRRGE